MEYFHGRCAPGAAQLDLTSPAVLLRSASVIENEGHTKNEFVDDHGYCAAGAIGKSCGIDPGDWYGDDEFRPLVNSDDPRIRELAEADYIAWKVGRSASLAALRTLIGHLFPKITPEEMSRRELLEKIADWNDEKKRTPEQVVAELRAAAREAVTA
jgi:hypothetical protein